MHRRKNVAIGGSERQARKASHCGSKQQQKSLVSYNDLCCATSPTFSKGSTYGFQNLYSSANRCSRSWIYPKVP